MKEHQSAAQAGCLRVAATRQAVQSSFRCHLVCSLQDLLSSLCF